jgi:hypothetical protein
MDVLTLRSGIATALTGLVGTYTLGNGSTTPAISVRDLGQGLAPGTTVSGLEVVIYKQPELVPVRQYRDEKVQTEWTVYLVGWSTAANMEAAGAALVAKYPNSDVATITMPENIGPRNQLRLTIRA